MSHPRVEEVSDSDPDAISDPEEVDIDDFAESDILRARGPDTRKPAVDSDGDDDDDDDSDDDGVASDAAAALAAARARAAAAAKARASAAAPSAMNRINSNNSNNNNPPLNFGPGTSTIPPSADRSMYSTFQCLYPVYFDASRSRAEGRRVSKSLAVKDPLAREIANACSRLRLATLLEPEKIHPKDWANPGRVKVGLKKGKGERGGGAGNIVNKHHLYLLVAQHLRDNPTTEDSPGLRLRVGGVMQPPEGKPYPKPAVPRGWKMGELLPYLSASMTGGGVSENLFKDMMKEMQGGGDPMTALMAGQAGSSGAGASGAEESDKKKKKKEKKGKGKV